VLVSPNELEPDVVRQSLDNAGLLVGIGDYRPKFGRFTVTAFEVSDD